MSTVLTAGCDLTNASASSGEENTQVIRDDAQTVDDVELALRLRRGGIELVHCKVCPLRLDLLVTLDAAGEPAVRERAPDQDAHPVLLRERQHVGLDCALEDRVGD